MINGLLHSYVNAINEGAVPNIENAWTYICRNQCKAYLEKNYEYYEEGINDTLRQGWPVSSSLLNTMHKDLMETAMKNYKVNAVGDFAEEYKDELESKIMEKFNQLKLENKREFERILVQSMMTYYKPIQEKVTNMGYRNFYDFEAEVRAFQNKYMEMEPHGPNKELLIVEFVHKKFIDATYQFIKGLQKNSHEQLQAINTAREELDKELLALKEEKSKVKNDLMNKISDLESAKNEVDVKLQCVTDSLTEMKKHKEESEATFSKQ